MARAQTIFLNIHILSPYPSHVKLSSVNSSLDYDLALAMSDRLAIFRGRRSVWIAMLVGNLN
jgi:hypothetical protein